MTSTEAKSAIERGEKLVAKPAIGEAVYSGDWYRIDQIAEDGRVRVDDTVDLHDCGNQWFVPREIEEF